MQGGNPYGNPGQGFGAPGFGTGFDQDNSFIISGDRKRHKKEDPNDPVVERGAGVFHEKLGSIIGPAYISGNIFNLIEIDEIKSFIYFSQYLS